MDLSSTRPIIMKNINELFAWVYQGKPAFADPVAELFERSIPISAIVLACLCGIVALICRKQSVNQCVQAIMAGLSLIGVGFFVIRMVGYYSFGSAVGFEELALGISFSWQSTALFFCGIAIALISVLVAQVVEKRALARVQARVEEG